MRESAVCRSLIQGLKKASGNEIYIERHEDMLQSGVPDIHYCFHGRTGWIEVKQLAEYPKREETKIRIGHFTPAQKLWLYRYSKAGGMCWIILRIEKDSYLFSGKHAHDIEQCNKPQLKELAAAYNPGYATYLAKF